MAGSEQADGGEGGAGLSGDSLEVLRAWLVDQPTLQAELGALYDPQAFVAALGEAAAAAGLAVPTEALAQFLRPDPLGLARWQAAPVNPAAWPGPGWLPTRSLTMGPEPVLDWAWFGNHPLDQPFYEDVVRQTGALPLSQFLRARTSLSALVDGWRAEADPVVPAGLVFHLSRCGSTLVARMLQNLPGCYCASEPEPFDAAVQWAARTPVSDDIKIMALRATAAALGRNRPTPDARFFLKLDCWHTLSLPLIRAAFPETPWLFLYRDPLEVAVSQLAMAGVHIVPGMLGAEMMGIVGGEAMPPEEYCAHVLGRICAAAADFGPADGGLFVDYRDMLPALQSGIPAHFGITMDETARAIVNGLTAISAKQPGTTFVPDSAAKRSAAAPAIIAAVDAHARPAYQRLATFSQTTVATH